MTNTTQDFIGAIYQISNSNNNSILIYGILKNGKLQFYDSVPTRGKGTSLNMTDPLFSQNSIVVYDNNLFAVNPDSNTLSIFSINPSNPLDIKLLNVIDTDGDYPVSIAVNQKLFAVLNGGTKSNLRCFTWDPSGNVMMNESFSRDILLNPPQSKPPNGPPNTVSDIAFNPSNNCLIISYKGSNMNKPGGILIYPIKNDRLATNPVKTVLKGGFLPFGMKTIGNNSLIVTNASNGVNSVVYDDITGMGRSSDILPIEGAVCWVTYAPKTNNYYVIGATSDAITEVSVNQLNLKTVDTYNLPSDSDPNDSNVAIIDNRNYLYVNCPGNRNITILSIDSPGNAKIIDSIDYPSNYSSTKIVGMAIKMKKQNTSNFTTNINANSQSLIYSPWFWIIILLLVIIIIYLYKTY